MSRDKMRLKKSPCFIVFLAVTHLKKISLRTKNYIDSENCIQIIVQLHKFLEGGLCVC